MKDSVTSIVDCVRATIQDMNMQLAIVGYCDIADTLRCEVLDFVTSINNFKEVLSNLNTTGGADAPEDMANAISEANKLSWTILQKLCSSFLMSPVM